MRLAVLADAVGDIAKTPGLHLRDLAAIVLDNLGCRLGESIDLGLCQILTREEDMLVERHVRFLSVLADRCQRTIRRPSGCRPTCIGCTKTTSARRRRALSRNSRPRQCALLGDPQKKNGTPQCTGERKE